MLITFGMNPVYILRSKTGIGHCRQRPTVADNAQEFRPIFVELIYKPKLAGNSQQCPRMCGRVRLKKHDFEVTNCSFIFLNFM